MVWSQQLDIGVAKQIFCDLMASKDGRMNEMNNERRTDNVDGNVIVLDPQYV